MREMKDSGVEWIGEIPDDWEIVPTKRFFRNIKRVVGNEVDNYERLALTMNGVIKRSKEDSEGLQPEKFEGYQILRKNELVFKLIDLENIRTSRVGLSSYTGLVSPAYIVLTNESKDNRFYYYWFMFLYYNQVFNHLGGNGVRSALNAKDLSVIPIVSIPTHTQYCIADYLDEKCAKIDTIIAKQQEIIEKLKEYKQSVITETVIKGLNPDVEMKDSGIEFIGEIPSHWKIVRLKFLLTYLIDCPHETPKYDADGKYLVIRTADQDLAILRKDEDMFRLSENEYQNRIRRMSLDKDDIVYGREGGRWGLACLVTESNKYCLGQRMLQFRCDRELFSPQFAVYALSSSTIYMQGSFDTMGSASPHVNISTVQNYAIAVPPLQEQECIAKKLQDKCNRIELEIKRRQGFIEKITAYKKSLIYEVVTGKRSNV